MSRCLPFSPESLSKRRSSHKALIKLQKEKEELNTLRKREKDLKRNTKKRGDDKSEKKHRRLSKQYDAQMAMSDDSISGKSDVTEEFRPPTYSTRIGTENPITNKRKREEESPDGVESKRIILRFRLPLKKHSAPDASLTESAKNPIAEKNVVVEEAEQPIKKPFTKRPEKKIEEKPSEKNKNVQVEAEKPFTKSFEKKNKNVQVEEAENPFTKRLEKNAEEAEQPSKVDAKKHKSSRRSKRSSTYKMLIEDWVPPSIDQLTEKQIACEDDDWLFGSRKKQEHEKQDQEYCLSSGLWPQATRFPEVDIYALPYTILF